MKIITLLRFSKEILDGAQRSRRLCQCEGEAIEMDMDEMVRDTPYRVSGDEMMMMIVILLFALKGHVEPAGSPVGFMVPSS